LRLFHWLCASEIPRACDLRRRGWQLAPLVPVAARTTGGIALAHFASMDAGSWAALTELPERRARGRMLLLGVRSAGERARLLRRDFGDVLGGRLSLCELEARAARVAGRADALPRTLQIGALRLDLLARDGFVDGRPLGIHPREFALLWRLAETPGVAVGKPALVHEVWGRRHVPDTNSVAVHVSRLRSKLALAGLAGLVQTALSGGYLFAVQTEARALPLPAPDPPLDRHVRLTR
jgi:DNA-binding winged helix-turn-helix (wHTH) protein